MRFKFGIVILFLFFKSKVLTAQVLPVGFIDTVYSSNWQSVVCFEFDKNGQQYVVEKKGRIWIVDTNNVRLTTPLLDINEEVGVFGDNGLTGFVLDPEFLNNGYFYIFYTVDRHHLLYFGTPLYDSTASEQYQATICRLTRYTADSSTNFHTIVPNSRLVLLGEDKKTGVPVLYPAHTGGTLLFGSDTSLIVSTSDGASYGDLDTGSVPTTYWLQALNDSIIPAGHNVGALRSLLKGSLNGKILRLDRHTGNGLNSNPFFDSTDVRSPKSRTYALGFRNPYRITIIPGTGSTDITAGNPGILLVGEVGWNTWEEFNIIKSGGGNYGWPIFEGLNRENKYSSANIPNVEAPNPLYNIGACTQPYFTFADVLKQPTANGIISYPNLCDSTIQIPDSLKAIHTRPDLDWRHGQKITRIPTFTGNTASVMQIANPNSTVFGDMFDGSASLGGVYYTGNNFPFAYKNTYFHLDYGAGWINNFRLDNNYNLKQVLPFDTALGFGKLVFLTQNPKNGCLMYISYQNDIRQICYTGQVNYPPTSVIVTDTIYGSSPLTVNFDGSQSTDPESQPLQYSWNFGDGNSSTVTTPTHTYTAVAGVPTVYTASLLVTDDSSYTGISNVKIYLNDSPPSVNITSIPTGTQYSITAQTNLLLQAAVSDAESPNDSLKYAWQTTLYHNAHTHPEAIDADSVTYTILSPIGCDGETYFYRISLTVTDPLGLSATDFVDVYPLCNAGINDDGQKILMLAMPNPAKNQTTIRLFGDSYGTVNVSLLSIDGKEILSKKQTTTATPKYTDVTFSVNDLASGIYFIKTIINHKTIFGKLIIE
ncbi:MAG: PQQ-dependent sugar dehydrogenase [Bacteroidia bacterium]|nr:PQQ-dependent sugar dehydrogenase [Bacteroidia bacterium]